MRLLILALILLAACQPTVTTPLPTALPTTIPLEGSVTIDLPAAGTLIYSESVRISGTASGLPDDQFALVLTASEEQALARVTIPVEDGQWQIDLLHGYNDVPSEVIIAAYPLSDAQSDPYDLHIVAMAALEHRPEGTYGFLTLESTSLGGGIMPVRGIASGLGDAPLIVRLLTATGDLISETSVLIDDPSGVNEVPWTAELARNDYVGPAELLLLSASEEALDSQAVTIEAAAG